VYSLFGWLVADVWCWFVLSEEYCWLVADGWCCFVLSEEYCWLVADKPSEQCGKQTSGCVATVVHSWLWIPPSTCTWTTGVCGVACRRVVPLTPGRQSSGEVVVVCRLTEFSALNWRTAIMRPPTADGRRATTILMIRRSFKNTYIVVLLLF
jgi:hypothetical protein